MWLTWLRYIHWVGKNKCQAKWPACNNLQRMVSYSIVFEDQLLHNRIILMVCLSVSPFVWISRINGQLNQTFGVVPSDGGLYKYSPTKHLILVCATPKRFVCQWIFLPQRHNDVNDVLWGLNLQLPLFFSPFISNYSNFFHFHFPSISHIVAMIYVDHGCQGMSSNNSHKVVAML